MRKYHLLGVLAFILILTNVAIAGWSRGSYSRRYIDVSVGSDGTVWGFDSEYRIWRKTDSGWSVLYTKSNIRMQQISVASEDLVWGVSDLWHKVYRWNGSDWVEMGGTLKQVSVGSDGCVWGVNDDNEIFRRHGDGWDRISGTLMQISVGSIDHIWGVNDSNVNNIYYWNGSSWTRVNGVMKQVSVGADGTVWAVSPDNEIFRRSNDEWVKVDGFLYSISVGDANHIWGEGCGWLYFWDNSHDDDHTGCYANSQIADMLEEARQQGYQAGVAVCESGNFDPTYCATFDFFAGTLHIPCFTIGTPETYWIDVGISELKDYGVNE